MAQHTLRTGWQGKTRVLARLPWHGREGEETRVYHFRLRP